MYIYIYYIYIYTQYIYIYIYTMKEAVRKVIDTLTQEYFHGAFQKLLERKKQVHCFRMKLLRR